MQVVSEQVTDILRQRILEQVWRPGEKVPIDQFARDLGVSHTPIREALGRLQGEGLVVYRRNQGYYVMSLSARDLHEMLDCRLILEVFAARQINSVPDRLVGRLEEIHSRFCSAMAAREYMENNAADREFHDTIVAASGNSLLLRLFRSMNSHMHTLRLFYFQKQTRLQELDQTFREHDGILSAFQRRNSSEAADALADHLRSVKRRAEVLTPLVSLPAEGNLRTDRGGSDERR
ncbi:MAG: GntR family transcriptional regulator [bacterium]|nr:GntR family transcriptional regulator [bacterium]